MSIIDNEQDLLAWAECSLDSDVAPHLVYALLEGEHPPYGQDWTAHLWDNGRWVLAHARWRMAQRKQSLDVTLHGRGVRVRDGHGLDVFVTDFEEFDRVLDEWKRRPA